MRSWVVAVAAGDAAVATVTIDSATALGATSGSSRQIAPTARSAETTKTAGQSRSLVALLPDSPIDRYASPSHLDSRRNRAEQADAEHGHHQRGNSRLAARTARNSFGVAMHSLDVLDRQLQVLVLG